MLCVGSVGLAHGGLTTLGANVVAMGVVGPWVGYGAYRLLSGTPLAVRVFCAMALADLSTYVMTSTQLALAFPGGDVLGAWLRFLSVFAVTQIPLAVVEGLVGVVVVNALVTWARPELTDLVPAEGFEYNEVLAFVAAVETRSEHPIAEAIVDAAKQRDITLAPVGGFEATPGFGVSAKVAGRTVAVGADRFMTQIGIDVSDFLPVAQRLGDQGKSPLYAAIDGRLAAVIAVADPIRETTPEAIKALHALGLKVAMITGDNAATAAAIARQLGIDEVAAEVLPDGKVAALKKFRTNGARVAFVGDGINDAPALAAADVGIAMGTGTDVAMSSAQITLVKGDLRGILRARRISQATVANMKQNLTFAFLYNALGVPVAAGVLYPAFGILLSPMVAALAMRLS